MFSDYPYTAAIWPKFALQTGSIKCRVSQYKVIVNRQISVIYSDLQTIESILYSLNLLQPPTYLDQLRLFHSILISDFL